MSRYSTVCVAPDVPGWNLGDDFDVAVVRWASDDPGHFDIYDQQEGKYVTPGHPSEVEEARQRIAERSPSPALVQERNEGTKA